MIRWKGAFRAGALALAVAAAAPLWSHATMVFSQIESGRWELRDMDDERRLLASVCVGDPMLLMQTRHGAAACGRTVVAVNGESATVRYSCPGNGFGQTTLRLETPRLARIDSQGVYRGLPFGFRAEARRVGTCGNAGR